MDAHTPERTVNCKLHPAAKLAGQWWADRLNVEHQDKRDAFAECVAAKISDRLNEGAKVVWTEVDYDPRGLLLDAVREVIDPSCQGMMFSARGILPQKHELDVYADKLVPKEGYGNWTDEILVSNGGAS